MKKRIFQLTLFFIAFLTAIYVSGFRLLTFFFELGFKTPQTDNFKTFVMYNLPDLISVFFCFYFIIYFFLKLKNAIFKKHGN
jgi:hypothetical protein